MSTKVRSWVSLLGSMAEAKPSPWEPAGGALASDERHRPPTDTDRAHNRMEMRMPRQEFSVGLDSRDHARRHVVSPQKPPDFCLDAGPGAGREFSQQAAVEASVESQTLGNRQHNLPVCDRGANFFGHMDCSQQGAFLVARRTGTTLLAGIVHEHLMAAIGAANPRKTYLRIAALEKGGHAAVDHRSPDAVLGLKLLVVHLSEGVKMLVQQPPQIGSTQIAWPIQR